MTQIKFCGMTRSADAVFAAGLGVDYIGCVFANGPRRRTPDEAQRLFASLGDTHLLRRVGVFGSDDLATMSAIAESVPLEVVQLHGTGEGSAVERVRQALGREVWAVVRCVDGRLPADAVALWDIADAVMLDAYVPGRLGGTGVVLPWEALAEAVATSRAAAGRRGRLVLAGGLTAENVGQAIGTLRPDVVDTSSGIEAAPGVKDPARMTAFVQAVAAADGLATQASHPSRSF